MNIPHPTRRASLLMGLGTLMSLDGRAQGHRPSPEEIDAQRRASLKTGIMPTQWRQAVVSETGMRASMEVASSRPLTGVPALQGFSLQFENGDHKLNRLGVLPGRSSATLTLADQDANDPFAGRAQFAVISAGASHTLRATGGGQFELPMQRPRGNGMVPVLCGFEFARRPGTDANVRAIGVWMDEARDVIRVTLLDDQGMDFRGFERTVGAVLAVGVMPMGELLATGATARELAERIPDAGRQRGYGVTVHYAWVERELFEGQGRLTGTSPQPSSGMKFEGPIVLTGFEFFFLNGDHHLRHIGVFDPGLQAARGNAEHVAYQDNNRDDPMRWAVSYRQLKADRQAR